MIKAWLSLSRPGRFHAFRAFRLPFPAAVTVIALPCAFPTKARAFAFDSHF